MYIIIAIMGYYTEMTYVKLTLVVLDAHAEIVQ